jgi:hypothetical protein
MNERRDDWHTGVDENLASLNAGQRVWEREVSSIKRHLEEFDRLVRGDPDKETDGLMSRLHQLENEINKLKAVVLRDTAGNKGLIGRVEILESEERTAENRWKFATAFTVALLSLIGLILTNWTRLLTYFDRRDPVDQAIEAARHPKGKHKHYVIREAPISDDEEAP